MSPFVTFLVAAGAGIFSQGVLVAIVQGLFGKSGRRVDEAAKLGEANREILQDVRDVNAELKTDLAEMKLQVRDLKAIIASLTDAVDLVVVPPPPPDHHAMMKLKEENRLARLAI